MRRAALFLLVTFATVALHASTLMENVDRTFDVRPGALFKIDNMNGHIYVRSWDQPRIRVRAVKTVSRADEPRKALEALRIDFQQQGGGLTVHTNYPASSGIGFIDFLTGNWVEAKV